jgi:HEPN domain-containing protein
MTDKWILDAARDFRIGSAKMGSPFEGGVFPLRSAVVTLAFSIELYLKYLAARTLGAPVKGHDLSYLFGALPQTVRDAVGTHYAHSRPITEVLAAHKDAFIEWRYIYEQQAGHFSLDIQSLRLINEALEATANGLK